MSTASKKSNTLRIRVHTSAQAAPRTEVVITFPFRIGSHKDNDLVLDHPSIAHHHAVLEKSEEHLILKDLGSAGGMFVTGNRISEYHLVRNESVVLGSIKIDFLVTSEQSAYRSSEKSSPKPIMSATKPTLPLKPVSGWLGLILPAVVLAMLWKSSPPVNQMANSLQTIVDNAQTALDAKSEQLRQLAPEIDPNGETISTNELIQKLERSAHEPGVVGRAQTQTQTQNQTWNQEQELRRPLQTPSQPLRAKKTFQTSSEASPVPTTDPVLTIPERLIDFLPFEHPFLAILFVLLFTTVIAVMIRLASPATTPLNTFGRSLRLTVSLAAIAQSLKVGLPVLGFNLDNHRLYLALSGAIVVSFFIFALYNLCRNILPEIDDRTALRAAFCIVGVIGAVSAGAFKAGLIHDPYAHHFHGRVSIPLKQFTKKERSIEQLHALFDRSLAQAREPSKPIAPPGF